MAKDFNDGVCEVCGNTGIADQPCSVCGGFLTKVKAEEDDPITSSDEDLPRKPDEPEAYPLDLVDSEGNILDDDDFAGGKL